MLCATIKGPSFEEAAKQILSLPLAVDILEFRLDCFEGLNESFLERLRAIRPIPVIFTLRDPKQGSHYKGSETERLRDIQRYAALNPNCFDIECTCPPDFISLIIERQPSMKIILSYHNHDETPEDLDAVYASMRNIPAHLYKIATFCKNSTDALRLLLLTKNAPKGLCAMGMGAHGEITRILGSVYGSSIVYASVSDSLKMVEGQLSASTLLDIYNFTKLNTRTSVYGVIGDPVSKSIGHIAHNRIYKEMDISAVYVRIPVAKEELQEITPLFKALDFKGLSVTMPLKEDILPFTDHIDPYTYSIGASNTLRFDGDGIHAYNTDGIGALNAIEEEYAVKGKHIIIVGAGGSSKAIIVEALRRGALVSVLNRSYARAEELAKQLPVKAGALADIAAFADRGYDILINCTPVAMPFDAKVLTADKIIMDIKTVPKMTELLAAAIEIGCPVIFGYKMYIEQALEQYSLWFNDRDGRSKANHILQEVCADLFNS